MEGGDASAGWCDYNDSQVTPIDLMTLERMMGGTATAAAEDEGEDEALAPPEPEGAAAAAVPGVESWSGGSASNAYMLVYRQRNAAGDLASGTDMTELLPPKIQADIASEGYNRILFPHLNLPLSRASGMLPDLCVCGCAPQ